MSAKQLRLGEAPPAYIVNDRPTQLGRAQQVTYGKTGKLLQPGRGFMRAYKFLINPYGGCGFGCEYCYARFFAPTPELRDTWGTWVGVKENAREIIEKTRNARSDAGRILQGDAVYISTVTDPYQPLEGKLGLTRSVLEALVPFQPRVTIQTRSPIATRDIDVFKRFERIRVNFTVSTDDEQMRLRYEPHCPAIDVRLHAAEEVATSGVQVGISVSPMLPIRDIHGFSTRIAAINAAEYVTQYFKDPRSRFTAGSTVEAVAKAREDGWGRMEYERARQTMASILGPGRPLLEGKEGYAPPG